MQTGAGLCFNCSGKGHDCPAGKRSESRGPRSGSEELKVAKTTGVRPRSRERRDGTEKECIAGQERPEPVAKINPMKESIVTITPIPDEAAKVVGEVNHLLKGFSGPTLKSVGTGGDLEVDESTSLLDGGATHPLRQGTKDEIKNAVQVTVELAHGATQLYQNPVNGTLLSEIPVEPIVPVRGLVELQLHHHLVPSRMCGEASTVGEHRMLVEVRMPGGPEGPRSGSDH